jgi:hypothetical protein
VGVGLNATEMKMIDVELDAVGGGGKVSSPSLLLMTHVFSLLPSDSTHWSEEEKELREVCCIDFFFFFDIIFS